MTTKDCMNKCMLCKYWRDDEKPNEYPGGYIVKGRIGICCAPKMIEDATDTEKCEMFLFDFDGMSAAMYTTYDFYCAKFEQN